MFLFAIRQIERERDLETIPHDNFTPTGGIERLGRYVYTYVRDDYCIVTTTIIVMTYHSHLGRYVGHITTIIITVITTYLYN